MTDLKLGDSVILPESYGIRECSGGSVKIHGCARCGYDHDSIQLYELTNPTNWTHWATCPRTDEPIMIRDEPVKEVQ